LGRDEKKGGFNEGGKGGGRGDVKIQLPTIGIPRSRKGKDREALRKKRTQEVRNSRFEKIERRGYYVHDQQIAHLQQGG